MPTVDESNRWIDPALRSTARAMCFVSGGFRRSNGSVQADPVSLCFSSCFSVSALFLLACELPAKYDRAAEPLEHCRPRVAHSGAGGAGTGITQDSLDRRMISN